MINTIVLDIGNVLVRFNWKGWMRAYGLDNKTAEALAEVTVHSSNWLEFDRSLATDEEIVNRIIQDAPDYEEEIRTMISRIGETIEPFPYAESFIRQLKQNGYQVFILSNYASITLAQTREKLSFLKAADGAILSCEVHKVKPEKEIYQELVDRYGVLPEQSVFLDDLQVNLDAASALGFSTILFQDLAQASAALKGMGVRI